MSCSSLKLSRRFGRKFHIHFQRRRTRAINQRESRQQAELCLTPSYSSTLMMEAICSNETSVDFQRSTWRCNPEDGTFHNYRCDNLRYSKVQCEFSEFSWDIVGYYTATGHHFSGDILRNSPFTTALPSKLLTFESDYSPSNKLWRGKQLCGLIYGRINRRRCSRCTYVIGVCYSLLPTIIKSACVYNKQTLIFHCSCEILKHRNLFTRRKYKVEKSRSELEYSYFRNKFFWLLVRCLKSVKIRTCKTIILPVVRYRCETWFLTLREEHRLRMSENWFWGEYLDWREMKWQEVGESLMRSFINCDLRQI
jgi:hypothetical protein